MRFRSFSPKRDDEFLRRCIIELQETERSSDPRMPSGPSMVEAYCKALLERCHDWNGVIFVAEVADQSVGLLSIFLEVPETEADEPSGVYALISDLVVLAEHRGQGIGGALLTHAEAYAKNSGCEVLRLEVMASNQAARQFYRRQGWKERVVQLEKQLPGPDST